MIKKYRLPIFSVVAILLLDILIFFIMYFFGKSFDFYPLVFLHLIASIAAWVTFKIKIYWKLLCMVLTFILTNAFGFILILSTMFLPGSKEHNHIMYDICLPAMRKHYGIKEGEEFPRGTYEPVDKNGNGIWWYQHLECEQNVREGKGPRFSDNPVEFHPIK